MYFSRVYASPYFNKGFMYTVVLILSTGIFLPQKAAALTPNEIDRMVNIFCEFYNRVTKDAEQLTTKQFGFCYGVDYTTQMISKHVALSLTYGRKCLSVYNSLPGHQKLVYMAVEAGMHTYAVTSQINLSCAALDIDPTSKRRLTSELFSLAIQKILNETNSESAKSNSGTFGSGKPN